MDLGVPCLGTRNCPVDRWVVDAVAGAVAADSAVALLERDSLHGKCAYYRCPFVAACVAVSAVNALALEHVGYLEDSWEGHHQAECYLLVLAKMVLVGFDSLDQLVFGHLEEKS